MSAGTGIAAKVRGVAYHGGRSWDTSGLDFKKRRQLVVADVLDAPFEPSPSAIAAITNAGLNNAARESPPTHCEPLIERIAEVRGVSKESLVVSSGSSSLLFSLLPRLIPKDSKVLLLRPTYSEYAHVLQHVVECGAIDTIDVDPDSFGDGAAVLAQLTSLACSGQYSGVFIVNPNSPTGTVFPDLGALAASMAQESPHTVLWVDECYIDYAIGAGFNVSSVESHVMSHTNPNLIVCKSLSKSLALSGLRVAYAVGARAPELRRWLPPWAVSLPGQLAAIAALSDSKYYAEQYAAVAENRRALVNDLRSAGLHVQDGVANFVSVLRREGDAELVVQRSLAEHNVCLRLLNQSQMRVAVRTAEENARIVAAIVDVTLNQ